VVQPKIKLSAALNKNSGRFMHILGSIVLILGATIILVLGLISVLRDLIERSPHQGPVIEEDGLAWPPRYQGTAPLAATPADSPANTQSFRGPNWPGEQESGQT
jgi:hypothetical protein